MKKRFLSLVFLIPFVNFGQTFNRGIILPAIDSLKHLENYCCILSPEQGFSVYDNPNGKIIGTLKRENNKQNDKDDDQMLYNIYLISGTKKIKVDNYHEIEYELYALNYTDSIKGFIKVLDTLKSYWLNVNELKQKGFKTVRWMNFMINTSKEVLGFYANEPGLRLRKEPNANSEIIGSVRGTLFQIKLTGETSGQWNKVKVLKLKRDPCDSGMEDIIEYESEGWLKVINDNGEPNLWRYTRGC